MKIHATQLWTKNLLQRKLCSYCNCAVCDRLSFKMQVLVYPHTSTATQKFDSYVKYKDAPYMSFDVLEWFVITFFHCICIVVIPKVPDWSITLCVWTTQVSRIHEGDGEEARLPSTRWLTRSSRRLHQETTTSTYHLRRSWPSCWPRSRYICILFHSCATVTKCLHAVIRCFFKVALHNEFG